MAHTESRHEDMKKHARVLARSRFKSVRDIGGALERYLAPSSPGRWVEAREDLRAYANGETIRTTIRDLSAIAPVDTALIDALSEIARAFYCQ